MAEVLDPEKSLRWCLVPKLRRYVHTQRPKCESGTVGCLFLQCRLKSSFLDTGLPYLPHPTTVQTQYSILYPCLCLRWRLKVLLLEKLRLHISQRQGETSSL